MNVRNKTYQLQSQPIHATRHPPSVRRPLFPAVKSWFLCAFAFLCDLCYLCGSALNFSPPLFAATFGCVLRSLYFLLLNRTDGSTIQPFNGLTPLQSLRATATCFDLLRVNSTFSSVGRASLRAADLFFAPSPLCDFALPHSCHPCHS
jgi:hypothetical protein